MDATLAAIARSMMGSKDKGGRNSKTVAAKDLEAKRLDKKAKRSAADAK